jgi:hypothetical protein
MIRYSDALAYLDAIADATGGAIDASPHGRWWKDASGANLSYDHFKTGTITSAGIVPPVPILDQSPSTDKSNSFFYKILLGPGSSGGTRYKQMPDGGPLITDTAANTGTGNGTDTTPGSVVFTLGDGTLVTGKKIGDDLLEWLKAGAPN